MTAEGNAIHRAREAAKRRGWRVQSATHGMMLINERNTVIAGWHYDLTAAQVIEICEGGEIPPSTIELRGRRARESALRKIMYLSGVSMTTPKPKRSR